MSQEPASTLDGTTKATSCPATAVHTADALLPHSVNTLVINPSCVSHASGLTAKNVAIEYGAKHSNRPLGGVVAVDVAVELSLLLIVDDAVEETVEITVVDAVVDADEDAEVVAVLVIDVTSQLIKLPFKYASMAKLRSSTVVEQLDVACTTSFWAGHSPKAAFEF